MAEHLTVPRAFALLLIEPDGRRVVAGQTFDAGLAGAVLADLALRGAVSLRGTDVQVVDGTPTGDPVLDGVVEMIGASGSPRSATWWVSKLGRRPLRDDVLGGLVADGLLTEAQRKTLRIFPSTTYPERDGGPESLLRAAIADVLAARSAPTPFTAAVIGLLDATGTLRRQFGTVDRGRVTVITSGAWASPAVKAVLDELQMAVIVSVVAVTAATTATTAGTS